MGKPRRTGSNELRFYLPADLAATMRLVTGMSEMSRQEFAENAIKEYVDNNFATELEIIRRVSAKKKTK